ncbi:hypothetical protein, partial [Clostridium perfringens]|nr:hypothetical protein [Clostridium perfringens]
IRFRNEKENILIEIKEINKIKVEKEKNIEKTKLYEYFNEIGNYIFLKNDLDNSIIELDRLIKLEEEKYIKELDILKNYEEKLKINKEEIDNIVEYRGMIYLRDSFVKEREKNSKKISENKKLLKPINKQLRKDKDKMKNVNKRYYDLMKNDIEALNLQNVIKDEAIKDILSNFKVGGSNIPLATMMYYMNLLQLKSEFNKEAMIFPVVIDSPNNTESDKVKEKMLYNYIFSKMNSYTQYI